MVYMRFGEGSRPLHEFVATINVFAKFFLLVLFWVVRPSHIWGGPHLSVSLSRDSVYHMPYHMYILAIF